MAQDLVYKGFIEYVDTEEEETTMIAMELRDLNAAAREGARGSAPLYAPQLAPRPRGLGPAQRFLGDKPRLLSCSASDHSTTTMAS